MVKLLKVKLYFQYSNYNKLVDLLKYMEQCCDESYTHLIISIWTINT